MGHHLVSNESAIAWKKEGYSHLRWIFTIAIIFGELTIAIINHDCPKITIIILSSNVASWIRNLNVKFDDFPKKPPYWPEIFQLVTFDYWIFENELEKYMIIGKLAGYLIIGYLIIWLLWAEKWWTCHAPSLISQPCCEKSRFPSWFLRPDSRILRTHPGRLDRH